MKERILFVSTILFCTIVLSAASMAMATAKTPDMVIRLNAGEKDLENGVCNIIDWPLSSQWVDKWSSKPDQIVLRSYVELGMTEIDINNQMWPTGDSNSKFYNPARSESVKAVEFRKAVACLLDRDAIVRNVLKGYGYRLDVPLPLFQSSFCDMINYTLSGYIYHYNKTRAISILDAAGFTLDPISGKRLDPVKGGYLQPLTFYVRQDDPNRRRAGGMLAAELRSVGIPVTELVSNRTVCYQRVMGQYSYHLYTGGWSLSAIPDQYYDLYSSYTYYGPSTEWSQNYVGFCNAGFDSLATQVKYPANVPAAEAAAQKAGYLFLKYCASVPMYSLKGVKAYRTGWTGVVNTVGCGIDNYYTFLNMEKSGDGVIDYGMYGSVERLNIISDGFAQISRPGHTPDTKLGASKVLNLIYESMMNVNPFNLDQSEFFVASASSIGSWNAAGVGGDPDATYLNFTIRDNILWHNQTGSPRRTLDVYDINFTFYYTKTCGPGVAINYPSLATFDHTVVYPAENKIGIYYKKRSAWTYFWAGRLPIINRDIWSLLPPSIAGKFDLTVSDVNKNGIADIKEDGTGGWQFTSIAYVSKKPLVTDWIMLSADIQYYLSATFVWNRLKAMFHDGAGDVNRDGIVDATDLGMMARALGTTNLDPPGTSWGQWNSECDLNSDNIVNLPDLTVLAIHYGSAIG